MTHKEKTSWGLQLGLKFNLQFMQRRQEDIN